MTFFTIQSIKDANKAIGHYFFSRDTMRFFKSRVHRRIYSDGVRQFIITSERGPSGVRAYSIRGVNPDGSIISTPEGFGGFQGHASLARAKSCLKAHGCTIN